MAFQIRESISSSVAGSSSEDIYAMVEDAIKKGDEHFLPGLGVFFENGGSKPSHISNKMPSSS